MKKIKINKSNIVFFLALCTFFSVKEIVFDKNTPSQEVISKPNFSQIEPIESNEIESLPTYYYDKYELNENGYTYKSSECYKGIGPKDDENTKYVYVKSEFKK